MNNLLKTLTEIEANQILIECLKNSDTEHKQRQAFRNHMIFMIMLETGLRVSEVCQLILKDLYYDGEPVTTLTVRAVIAKRNVERIIPISSRLSQALKNFLQYNPHPTWRQSFRYVFPGNKPNTHITPRQIQRILSVISQKAIGRKIHPHIFRHTFGTRLMRVAKIRVVQALLGHKNLSTTQLYTHPDHTDLTQAIKAM